MNKLLKVLDMTEGEQHQAICKYAWHHRKESSILADYHREHKGGYMETSLADLAFRLRDEAVENREFMWACAKVYNKAWKYKLEPHEVDAPTIAMWVWFANHAKPIHWIIAALIAKETK